MRDQFHWARLLSFVTGLVNQELLLRNEYLAAENRILRAHLPARLRLSDAERSRLVKIFMRRDCSIGVGRQDVLDSGCHVADRAQAEQGRGRAERCSCLGGCVLRDNALGTG